MVDREGNSVKIDHDPAILDRARRQHGHVARWQLLELGVSQGLIQGRLEAGAWAPVHKGVYCIGPQRDDPVSRAAAAVLAGGAGAVLSHGSAESLWGLLPRWSGPMEVTTKAKRARPGITTHRCRSFKPRDDARREGHLRADALNDILSRNPLHPGTKRLRRSSNATAGTSTGTARPSNQTANATRTSFPTAS